MGDDLLEDYEELLSLFKEDKSENSSIERDESITVYAPKCLVLLSPLPYMNEFRTWLIQLYGISLSVSEVLA